MCKVIFFTAFICQPNVRLFCGASQGMSLLLPVTPCPCSEAWEHRSRLRKHTLLGRGFGFLALFSQAAELLRLMLVLNFSLMQTSQPVLKLHV